MTKLIPEHLSKFCIDADTDLLPVDKSWITSLDVKLQVTLSNGIDKFYIRFSGERYDDGLLGPAGKKPLVVYAISEDGQEVLIFDQRIHGFESILTESKEFEFPDFSKYVDPFSDDKFRIYFFTHSNVDFEDEFTQDHNGLIETLSNGRQNQQWLRANAFDYIVVFIENQAGCITKIIELELL